VDETYDDQDARLSGSEALRILIRSSFPAPAFARAGRVAWGRCPLARFKGSLTLDRDGFPGLPRGCVFQILAHGFDPLVQAG
jgi:hypothetical protein